MAVVVFMIIITFVVAVAMVFLSLPCAVALTFALLIPTARTLLVIRAVVAVVAVLALNLSMSTRCFRACREAKGGGYWGRERDGADEAKELCNAGA